MNEPTVEPVKQESDIVSNTAAALEIVKKNPALLEKVNKYKVPVYYAPTRAMIKPVPTPGLLQFIEQAMTEREVNNLLEKGKQEYKTVSPKTVRKWEQAAVKRIAEIKSQK